jgi:hypothetical protein
MTRAKPATKISRLADWHTAQMRAHAQHNQPLGFLNSLLIRLRIAESFPIDILGLFDLVWGAMSDKDGLAAPFDDDVLALGNGGEVNLDFGHGEDVRGGGHVD